MHFQIISFLVTWFPYACVSIAETAGYIPKSNHSFYILAIPTMLTKSAVCTDPIIYFWLNPLFRAEMMVLLGISKKKTCGARRMQKMAQSGIIAHRLKR